MIAIFKCLAFSWQLSALTNLEAKPQDFILEVKQIHIPEYPDAFNPSIIRQGNDVLMCFRIRDPITAATDQIGFIWLDDSLNPIGKPQILEKRYISPRMLAKEQDPRLIEINDDLYMVFSNVLKTKYEDVRRVCVAKVHNHGTQFYIKKPKPILNFNGQRPEKQEKNWTPFIYNGDLLLSYSLNPHSVMQPNFDTHEADIIAHTERAIKWHWGELRGGTPGLLVDGEYLAFFHSSKGMATTHSEGKMITHYFMGAYTFAATPPFELTRVSQTPIVGKNFYEGVIHKTWKPLRVVFPGGFIFDDDYVWVVYGRQDHEIWIVKLDKEGLLKSLGPV